VPGIDTLLLLRPTESATVFLQQLGRGLRRAEGKACCTVLDFIGRPNRQFRFDVRFRALLQGSPREVERQVADGFPVLPAGCAIDLDREASAIVLENLRESLGVSLGRLVDTLRACRDERGSVPPLADFLDWSGLETTDVYRKLGGGWLGWTRLRREAGVLGGSPSASETALAAGVARLLHVDDTERLAAWRSVLEASTPPALLDARCDLAMLHFLLWGRDGAKLDLAEGFRRLRESGDTLQEIRELLALLDDRTDHLTYPLDIDLPLRVHASYTLDEILAALGRHVPGKRYVRIQSGVLFDAPSRCDVFFITTTKSARDYSPTTMYRDYAISPELFHWESQNATAADSETGRRYREHARLGTHVLLLVRRRKTDERGLAVPYRCLGLADYVRHEGERPMAVTWRLRRPMPAGFFVETRLAAA
jgi:hypothetical protein